MSPARTLENRLILACARVEPDLGSVEGLVKRGPDWEQVLRKTGRWGLAPLVDATLGHERLAGSMPGPFAERLRQMRDGEVSRAEAQRAALAAILAECAQAGLLVIVLKDAALAALVYPAPRLRATGSIDLLIHMRDRKKAHEMLRGMGYRPPVGAGSEAGEEQQVQLLYAGEGPPVIELHDEILRPWTTRLRIPVEDFWQRAQAVSIASAETLSFSREDMLLHLALELAREERFSGHVRTLCDIRELCGRYWIDWAPLIAQAKAYRMGKCLYFSLILARDLAGAVIPAFVLKDLRAGFAQLPLEGKFIAAVTRHEILVDDRPRSLFWKFLHELSVDLLSASRTGDGLIPVSRRLFRWSRRPLWRVVYRHGRPN